MAGPAKPERFAYIDWMRGFACLLMFEVHGYDSWLTYPLQETRFYRFSQFTGTIAAPIFLFLAGAPLALVSDRMRQKGATPGDVERRMVLRGFQIVGLGYLLRLQEYLMGWPKAPWTDLFRVDILNKIWVSRCFSFRSGSTACRFSSPRCTTIGTPARTFFWRESACC